MSSGLKLIELKIKVSCVEFFKTLDPEIEKETRGLTVSIRDSHCHFFSRNFFETLIHEQASPNIKNIDEIITKHLGWETPKSPELLSDRWCQELDRHDVAQAALIASVPGDEDSVASALVRHPKRFVGFFMLDPTRPDSCSRTKRALLELGLQGVCLFPAMHRYRLDDDVALQIFEIAASVENAAGFVHCGALTVGVRKKLKLPCDFDIRLGNPLDLKIAAARHPKLPIIIPHFGAGFFREALMAADLHPNIYFDTSSTNAWIKYHPKLTLEDVFRQALTVIGADRLLFGTDSSFFPRGWHTPVYERQKSTFTDLGLDSQTVKKIFQDNFARLFEA